MTMSRLPGEHEFHSRRSTSAGSPRSREIVVERVHAREVPELLSLLDAAVPDCAPETVWQLPYNWFRYFVAKRAGDGKLLAAGSLQPIDERRCEIRGLVVASDSRGCGLATTIVRHLVEEAEDRGLQTLCVTRKPAFFRRLGFHDTPPSWLSSHRRLLAAEKRDQPPRVSMACLAQPKSAPMTRRAT